MVAEMSDRKAGGQDIVSRRVLDPIKDYSQKSVAGMEGGVMIGTGLSCLVAALGGWWLGGQSLALGAVTGLATFCALPLLKPVIGQLFASGQGRTARNALK